MTDKEVCMFKARTNEGYLFKVLTELLQNNIKTACFVLNDEGIMLRMTDNLKKTLIDINIESHNFQIYKYKYTSNKMIGLNLSHLYKMLKSVKKKDTVELFIIDDNDNNLGIKIIPKDNTRITTSYVKIQNIQNININIPFKYNKPVIIPSSDYQKMIKDMISIGQIIKIQSVGDIIKFICIADGIYSREVEFGTNDDDDEKFEKTTQEFYSDQLYKLIKLSGLGPKLYIHISPTNPLLIKCHIGSLGFINIYLKNIEQIKKEDIN
jgi:proliferating cell nuclear antigen